MIADYLQTRADSREMGGWTQGKDTMAGGTMIALQIKAGRIATEVALNKTVAPKAVMATAGTSSRPDPRIILAQCKNILEQNGN